MLTEIGLIDDLVTLHWTNANLTGPLPTQLFKYNLSTIELGGNFLTGTLPTEFAINMKVSYILDVCVPAHSSFSLVVMVIPATSVSATIRGRSPPSPRSLLR